MSIYGPKIKLPKISLPKPRLPKINKKKAMPVLIIIALIILIILVISMADLDFTSSTKVSWKNNPLSLKNDTSQYAELELNIINNSKETTNITLAVTSESSEIIIFCPDNMFPNVASGNQRQTTCIVRRNPNEKVFSGNYTINIKTNLDETKTLLELRTK
jgi:hypothetical protein